MDPLLNLKNLDTVALPFREEWVSPWAQYLGHYYNPEDSKLETISDEELSQIYQTHSELFDRYLYLGAHTINAHIPDTAEYEEFNLILTQIYDVGITDRALSVLRTRYLTRKGNIRFNRPLESVVDEVLSSLHDDSFNLRDYVNQLAMNCVEEFKAFYRLYRKSKEEDWDGRGMNKSQWDEYHIAKDKILNNDIPPEAIRIVVEYWFEEDSAEVESHELEYIEA